MIRKAAGVVADDVTLGHAATACARGGDLDDALIILRAMAAKGMAVARAYNLALVAIAHGKTGPSRPTRCLCNALVLYDEDFYLPLLLCTTGLLLCSNTGTAQTESWNAFCDMYDGGHAIVFFLCGCFTRNDITPPPPPLTRLDTPPE